MGSVPLYADREFGADGLPGVGDDVRNRDCFVVAAHAVADSSSDVDSPRG